MYYVLLNGDIQKTFDTRKLASLARAGFYVCKSYIDAVIYSRAVLARGERVKNDNKKYFKSDEIFLA
jgi:hypothetical protein